MNRRLFCLCAALSLSACATTSGERASGGTPTLELTLTRADGRTIPLDAYAGQPLLLFLFATYDEASQLALVTLNQFLQHHPRVQVAGVMLQPDAATFLPLFKQAASVPFELYFDSSMQLLQGKTAIGQVRRVPAFIALDSKGRIRDIRYGVQNAASLSELTEP